MKLIIEIPEEEWLFTKAKIVSGDDSYVDRAVANGIPLDEIRDEIRKELKLENADIQSKYSQGGYDVLKRLFNTDIFR